jgi:hypothetical protein
VIPRTGNRLYSRPELSITKDTPVDYCHQHNLVDPDTARRDRRFGIRVTLPPTDTMCRVLGETWEHTHWYATEAERDAAFGNMARRHGYYRKSDTPTQVLEKISR